MTKMRTKRRTIKGFTVPPGYLLHINQDDGSVLEKQPGDASGGHYTFQQVVEGVDQDWQITETGEDNVQDQETSTEQPETPRRVRLDRSAIDKVGEVKATKVTFDAFSSRSADKIKIADKEVRDRFVEFLQHVPDQFMQGIYDHYDGDPEKMKSFDVRELAASKVIPSDLQYYESIYRSGMDTLKDSFMYAIRNLKPTEWKDMYNLTKLSYGIFYKYVSINRKLQVDLGVSTLEEFLSYVVENSFPGKELAREEVEVIEPDVDTDWVVESMIDVANLYTGTRNDEFSEAHHDHIQVVDKFFENLLASNNVEAMQASMAKLSKAYNEVKRSALKEIETASREAIDLQEKMRTMEEEAGEDWELGELEHLHDDAQNRITVAEKRLGFIRTFLDTSFNFRKAILGGPLKQVERNWPDFLTMTPKECKEAGFIHEQLEGIVFASTFLNKDIIEEYKVRSKSGASVAKIPPQSDGSPGLRSFADPSTNSIHLRHTANAGEGSVAAHEMAHLLEISDVMYFTLIPFFLKTVGEEESKPLQEIMEHGTFREDEFGFVDNFSDRMRYALKYYSGVQKSETKGKTLPKILSEHGVGSTELLSMGVQLMYEDAARFALEAPDFFKVIMGLRTNPLLMRDRNR